MPDSCPACEHSQFESLDEIPKPLCSACGFVIGDDVEPPPELIVDEETNDEPVPWSEFYSVTNETEKQVAQGFEHLVEISQELNVSAEAVRSASDLLVEAAISNLADGRSWKQIAAATLCLGARSANDPRPSTRIAEAANLPDSKIRQTTRLVQQIFEEGYAENPPENHIPFLCADIGLPKPVKNRSHQLLRSTNGVFDTSGVNPVGIAAAAVYLAADNDVTQREVAEAAGITQETIRVRINDIRETEIEVSQDD